MSTRSVIIKYYEEEKRFKAIYCHFDGYIEGVGHTLKNYYKDEEKINTLIQEGSISSLYETIEETKFYHRDYGHDKQSTKCTSIFLQDIDRVVDEALKTYPCSEYIYIFYKNEWIAYKVVYSFEERKITYRTAI